MGFLSVSPEPQAFAPYPYRQDFDRDRESGDGSKDRTSPREYRWAAGRLDILPDLSRELDRLRVDVIVTYGNKPPHIMKEIVRAITPSISGGAQRRPLHAVVRRLSQETQ